LAGVDPATARRMTAVGWLPGVEGVLLPDGSFQATPKPAV